MEITVKELRQLLFDVKDQDAKVVIDGKSLRGFQTAYNQTLVRLSSDETYDTPHVIRRPLAKSPFIVD